MIMQHPCAAAHEAIPCVRPSQVMEERAKKYPLPPIHQERASNAQIITATGGQHNEAL